MGLDVYLTKCANLAELKKAEAEYELATEGLYEDGKTDADREAGRKAAAQKFGTDEWGKAPGRETIEHSSAIDPAHYFKVGYFRSSYNEGGINNVLRRAGCMDLYAIFEPGDEYEVRPDWDACLARTNQAIEQYTAFLASDGGKYCVAKLSPMYDHGVATEKEALDLFVKTMAERHSGFGDCDFSNRDGEFYPQGITVRAVITKTYERPSNPILSFINQPTSFLIYDKPQEDGKEDWYLTALRIVKETIEYVLAQPDREQFYLRWSS